MGRDAWNTRDTTATAALTLELEKTEIARAELWREKRECLTERDTLSAVCGDLCDELETVKRERDAWKAQVENFGDPFVEVRQLRQQLAEARELLKERVFWTANDPAYSRQGYSALIDSETSFRDVNYRNTPLYATAEEAIDAALKALNPPTDEK